MKAHLFALFAVCLAGLLVGQETVFEAEFRDGLGPFVQDRGVAEDVRLADGVLALAGRGDGNVRSLAAGFGLPLSPGGVITVRQRAEAGAYGGLYVYAGGRNIIQLGLGQGRDGKGLMFELDNHSKDSRQTLYPEVGGMEEWREYRIEVEGAKVTLTVDGREVVNATYSGLPPDRVAIWNGMRSRGEIQTARVAVHWLPPAGAQPVAELAEDFGDPASLARWRGDGAYPEWEIVDDASARNGKALHSDFRRQGRWTLVCTPPLRLEARTAYRLRMRLRATSGVVGVRLSLRSTSPQPPARIDERATQGYADREATFVTGERPTLAYLVLEGVWGGGTVWIDSLAVEQADPPPSPYGTGVNLLHATLHEPGNRVGLAIEAEDMAGEGTSEQDADGDGKWARIRLVTPERVTSDVGVNPWGFSNNTVLKSDLEPGGEPLRLRFARIVPGRYRVYLSDPRRPAAVSLDGTEWTRIEGGNEAFLGIREIDPDTVLQVAHRHADPDNPGPVYADYVRLLPVHDEAAVAAAAGRVHAARAAAREAGNLRSAAAFAKIPLTIAERSGIARTGEPVTTGVPFARGTLFGGARLRLDDSAGQPVPCEFAPLVHWPDGSVKWLRLRFRADVAANQEMALHLSPDPAGQPIVPPAPVREMAAEEEIRTGSLCVALGPGFIRSVQVNGDEGDGAALWEGEPMLRLALGTEPARTVPLRIDSYREIERTLLGSLIEFAGAVAWDGPPVGVQGRLLVEQNRPVLSLKFWLVNRAPGRRQDLREAVLVLPVAGECPTLVQGLADGALVRPLEQGWEARQGGQGSTVKSFVGEAHVGRPGETPEWRGERLPGWLGLTVGDRAVALGIREFVERIPKGLAATPRTGGAWLEAGLLPAGGEPFAWHQGVALAHHIGIVFPDTPAAGRGLLASTLHPLRAVAPADVVCRSGAFGSLQPRREPALYPEFEAEVDRAFALIAAERSSFGIEDFGCVFQPGGYVPGTERMWTNLEYDFSHAALSVFARTGNADLLERADQATRHFVPVDIIHWSPDGRNTGGSHTHSHTMEVGHQVEGPNFGHGGWPQGPLQVYYLTGERQGLDAGLLLGGYIVRHAGPQAEAEARRPLYGLREERDAGNALLTCIVAYEATEDPVFLETAYRVLDWVERCQVPGRGNWATPITEDPPHRGTTFMIHQLYKGLDAMQQVTEDPRLAAIFRRHAPWLLAEARDERGRFAFKFSPRYWRGASPRNFAWYALGYERALAQADGPEAGELRELARGAMDALFGAETLARNALFETDTADRERKRSARVAGGRPGVVHDYALVVRGSRAVFMVDGETAWDGEFTGTPAAWVRLWSGMASVGTVAVRSFAVDRLTPERGVETVLDFDFAQVADLSPWRARLPETGGSRLELGAGGLQLVDGDQALIGAELDLPADLGPNYRLRWRQAMPEGQYGGLMVFGPGGREFDLYNHQPSAILHVGLNQSGGRPGARLFDNPRSFAPLVTYLNQLVAVLEDGAR